MKLTFEANNISEIRELHQLLGRLLAPEAAPTAHTSIKGDSLEDLPLSNRALNALRGENITTISQLMMLSYRDLMDIPNLGKVCAREIKDTLGFHLK
jgi:DNA-directed RNA polymerase alpha subunit